jgi:general secretion pathway protein D
VLRPLISANNTINAYPNNNTLIVTDYAENLKRLERIIEAIDVPRSDEPVFIPVNNMSAMDIAPIVNRLMQDNNVQAAVAEPGQKLFIAADARSNALIVRTDNPSKINRIKNLVLGLDKPLKTPGNIHVVYLKNAEATRVAQTLRNILATDSSGYAGPAQGVGGAATAGGAAPAVGGASGVPSSQIQADSATNALIITAPEVIYNNLRVVIDMLDRRRAQIHVEALIVEMTSDRAAEFGIQWQSLSGVQRSGGNAIAGTNFGTGGNNIIGAAQNLATVGAGLNLGFVNGKVTIPGVGAITNLGLLARFLESDNKTNILSTPNLMTLDNEEAKIVVGKNLPFITGQYAQTGQTATATPFQTIERRDVGLTLRVKPQITEGGVVRLQIFQEASSVSEKNTSGLAETNKRSIESTVLVDDGSILVLGGLIEDSYASSEDKVPLFGDIPIFGHAFRYDTRKRAKTNLMVFLRPTILRDAQASFDLSADRYDYIIGEQKKIAESSRSFPSGTTTPILPDRPQELMLRSSEMLLAPPVSGNAPLRTPE